LIIEILNTFCFSCQKQAPVYNELHAIVAADEQLKDKVKFIGIAVGNTQTAVDNFKNTYNVEFPIIPDEKYITYEAIGGARTPLTLYVVKNDPFPSCHVLKRHHRLTYRTDFILEDLRAMLTVDETTLAEMTKNPAQSPSRAGSSNIKPLLNEEQIMAFLQKKMQSDATSVDAITPVAPSDFPLLFSLLLKNQEKTQRIFAQYIAKPPTCGVCHDIHFIYAFDTDGKVVAFYPLQLTKSGNVAWNDEDIAMFSKHILGKYVFSPWSGTDADAVVTSATISTSVMLHNIAKGSQLIRALRDKGLLNNRES